ncbi:MAG: ATP-binding protein [Xanthomonadales bacterium]|jgi:signal transduction histidine kinase|nr:ATP-binding protein [Xanthomonadales bacterium]
MRHESRPAWRGALWLGIWLLGAAPLLPAASGPELPPTPQWLPFVLHDADDGLPSSRVTALAQDAGGWLWVGTSEGLTRWDGLRFERYTPEPGAPLPVTLLKRTADDALWIAVEGGGLWRLAPDRRDWRHYHRAAAAPHALPGDEVFALHEQAGALWVGLYAAGLLRIVDGVVEPLPAYPVAPEWSPTLLLGADDALYAGTVAAGAQRLALSDGRPQTLAAGRVMHAGGLDGGALWVAPSRQDLLRIDAAGTGTRSMPRLGGMAPASFAMDLRSDGWWFGTDRGLLRRQGERWQWFAAGAQQGLPDGRVVDLLVDREENLWLAIEGQGLARIDPPGAPQTVWLGGAARRAAAAERSADGSLLIGFRDGGLARIDPAGQLSWIGPAGAGEPSAILEQGGHWWLGHAHGLSRTPIGDPASWQAVDAVYGATERVDLLLPLPGGGVVASLYGSAVHALDAEGRLLARWPVGEALGPEVEALTLDAAGGLWIAHARGLCRVADPQDAAAPCVAVEALAGQRVRALAALDQGVLAADNTRLLRVSADRTLAVERVLDLDGALVSGLHATPDGRRWLSTGRGLLQIEADGSHRWHTQIDGLPTAELADRPFAVRDGELLIGSERGLIVRQIDAPVGAAQIPGAWRLHADGAAFQPHYRYGEPRPRLSLHAAQLAAARRAEYRFRLDGPLPQTGSARAAVQLDLGLLPPGEWRLHVESPAAAAPWVEHFRIDPPWWQTGRFRISALALLLLALVLGFRAWRRRLLLEHRLRLEQAQAVWSESLAAEKTEFVATLSHELRNQLQGLGASVALLKLRGVADLPGVLGRLEGAVAAMAGLLNDALELSRLEGGRLPLRPEALRLDHYAREIGEALAAAAAPQSDLQCRYHPQVAALSVMLDRLRFRQILLNLAGNALRHARSVVEVRLVVTHEAAAGVAHLQLAVQDDGPGIPAELRTRLFGRWQRGHGQGPEGSGLGLAICRQLVEAMGGSIRVDSEPGCTIFRVELALPATVLVEATPSGATLHAESAPHPVGILLLDGTEPLPMPADLELRRCHSPLQLLTLLDSVPEASALLVAPAQSDALRPLLPLLRSRRPQLRVLLLATAAMPADLARAREQGYDALLGLPLTMSALGAALRREG